jgi:hypothetical protein
VLLRAGGNAMTNNYVYVLATYDDDGLVKCCATLDRSRLKSLLIEHFTLDPEDEYTNIPPIAKEITNLEELLRESDEYLSSANGWDLGTGWGGVQLYVIKLD